MRIRGRTLFIAIALIPVAFSVAAAFLGLLPMIVAETAVEVSLVLFAILLLLILRHGIVPRVIGLAIAFAVLPIALLGSLNDRLARASLEAHGQQILQSAADSTAHHIEDFIGSALDSVRTDAKTPDYGAILDEDPATRSTSRFFADVADSLHAQHSRDLVFIKSCALIDLSGNVVYDTLTSEAGLSEAKSAYFEPALKAASALLQEEAAGNDQRFGIVLTAPVRNRAGEARGLLRVRYDAAVVQWLLRTDVDLLGPGSYSFVIDGSGRILAHATEPTWVGLSLAECPEMLGSANESSAENRAPRWSNKSTVRTATYSMRRPAWRVVFAQPPEVFLAPIDEQSRDRLVIVLIVSMGVPLIAFVLARRALNPLRRMRDAAQRISRGDLATRVVIESDDEVGETSEAFNEMAAKLEATLQGLRAEIRERERIALQLASSEEQLRQAQKMESIGMLAGGIAHDFNNLLVPIFGHAELALDALPANSKVRGDLANILLAAESAKHLVQQLLAFGRKQMLRMQSIDLREIGKATEQLIRRTLREDIALEVKVAKEPVAILGDITQIRQVLMNLVINAESAMSHGGRLTIAVRVATADECRFGRGDEVLPGDHALLEVSDTGGGMDSVTQSHVFEPFFTTKSGGRGTGLGLATVHGIVRQHQGFIRFESAVDRGSTFRVFLPLHSDRAKVDIAADSGSSLPEADSSTHRGKTILLVEDDERVRDLVARVLEGRGYKVLACARADEAITLVEPLSKAIDLLLTDVIMPQMNGKELHERLCVRLPDLAVLFMSGYTGDVIARHGVADASTPLLMKPFTNDELLRRVAECIAKSNTTDGTPELMRGGKP